ncbi:hypothetical protein C8J56DRAFT_891986 [Mycena floridula]|nr:hypothetical protein C8J56DRAFT_891986 [Mycena floridula]
MTGRELINCSPVSATLTRSTGSGTNRTGTKGASTVKGSKMGSGIENGTAARVPFRVRLGRVGKATDYREDQLLQQASSRYTCIKISNFLVNIKLCQMSLELWPFGILDA